MVLYEQALTAAYGCLLLQKSQSLLLLWLAAGYSCSKSRYSACGMGKEEDSQPGFGKFSFFHELADNAGHAQPTLVPGHQQTMAGYFMGLFVPTERMER